MRPTNVDAPGCKLQFNTSLMGWNRRMNRGFLLKLDATFLFQLQHSATGQQSIVVLAYRIRGPRQLSKVRNTNHKASHYVVFSSLTFLHPPKPKYLPHQPTLEHPQPAFFRNMRDQFSYPHKTTRKIIIMDTLFFIFQKKIYKTRYSRPNSAKNSPAFYMLLVLLERLPL